MTDTHANLVVYVLAMLTLAYCVTVVSISTVLMAYFTN